MSGSSQAQESAIGDHLGEHYICRTNYSDDRFSILDKAWCKKHLVVLKDIAIIPFLVQTEEIYTH